MIEKLDALMYFTFATYFFGGHILLSLYNTMNSDEAIV